MEYTFKDKETGDIIKISPERWVWGVIYQPTEAQIEAAKKRQFARNEQLKKELEDRVAAMHRNNADQKDIDTLVSEYEIRMNLHDVECDELHQFGDDGIFHQVGEIDQDRVAMASFYRYDDMSKRIDIPWRPGMKLIHKYRNVKPAGFSNFIRVYMWGYKYEGTHCYYFILPNDRMIISPEDDVDLTKFHLE